MNVHLKDRQYADNLREELQMEIQFKNLLNKQYRELQETHLHSQEKFSADLQLETHKIKNLRRSVCHSLWYTRLQPQNG